MKEKEKANMRNKVFFLIFFLFLANFCFALSLSDVFKQMKEKLVDKFILLGISASLLIILLGALSIILSLGGIETIGTTPLLSWGIEAVKAGFLAIFILLTSYSLIGILNPNWTAFSLLEGVIPKKIEEKPEVAPSPVPLKKVSWQELPLGKAVENVIAKNIDGLYFNPKGEIDDADPLTLEIFDPLLNYERFTYLGDLSKVLEIKIKELIRMTKIYRRLLKECYGYHCQTCQCGGKDCLYLPSYPGVAQPKISKYLYFYWRKNIYFYWPICKLEEKSCPCPEEKSSENFPQIVPSSALCRGVPCSQQTFEKLKIFYEKYFDKEKGKEEFDQFLKLKRNYFACLKINSVKDCSPLGFKIAFRYRKLSLYWQAKFITEEIKNLLQDTEKDLLILEKIKKRMESDYLVKPYFEFVKISEELSKKDQLVQIIPFEDISPAKYCKGFFYLDLHQSCPGDRWLASLSSKFKLKKEDFRFDFHNKLALGTCTAYCRKIAEKKGPKGGIIDPEKFFLCMKETSPCECVFEEKENILKCSQQEKECKVKFGWIKENCQKKEGKCFQDCLRWEKECRKDCQEWAPNEESLQKCFSDCSKEFNKKGKGGYLDQCHQGCSFNKQKCTSDYYTRYLFPCLKKVYRIGCQFCSDQYPVNYPGCWRKVEKFSFPKFPTEVFNWEEKSKKLFAPLCHQTLRGIWEKELLVGRGIENRAEASKCLPCSQCPDSPCMTCTGVCGEYSFDQDPLTFYSSVKGTQEIYSGPLAKEMNCDRKKAIPLGMLVDQTLKFPQKMIEFYQRIRKASELAFKIIESIKPENFLCEGKRGYLKEILNNLEKRPPFEFNSLFLEYLLQDPAGIKTEVETLKPIVGSRSATFLGKIREKIEDEDLEFISQFYHFEYDGKSTPCTGPIKPHTPCLECSTNYLECLKGCEGSYLTCFRLCEGDSNCQKNCLKNRDSCQGNCGEEKKRCEKTCKEKTFSFTVTNLEPGKNYSYRACSCDPESNRSLSCGSSVSFSTYLEKGASSSPQLETLPPAVGSEIALLKGKIIDDGGESVDRWFEWGEGEDLKRRANAGKGGKGIFSLFVSLKPATSYSFRACAQNSMGKTCSRVLKFKTLGIVTPPLPQAPKVKTIVAYPSSSGAVLVGEITDDGNAVSERWFYWGKTPQLKEKISAGKGLKGRFQKGLFNLKPETVYYFQACAENSAGRNCGQIKTFKTKEEEPPSPPPPSAPPEVKTLSSLPASISALLKGEIINAGGEISKRWFEINGKKIPAGYGREGKFEASATCLVGGKTYSFKACAENSKGSSCGPFLNFTTKERKPSPPQVVALKPKEIKGRSAILLAKVADWGKSSGSCQFFWGKKEEPCSRYKLTPWIPYSNQCDLLTYKATNLEVNTIYRYTVRCKNEKGKGSWSNWIEFKTTAPCECKTLKPTFKFSFKKKGVLAQQASLPKIVASPEEVLIGAKITNDGGLPCKVRFTIAMTNIGIGQFAWPPPPAIVYEMSWQEVKKIKTLNNLSTGDIAWIRLKTDGFGLPKGTYLIQAESCNDAGCKFGGLVKFQINESNQNPIPLAPYDFKALARNHYEVELFWTLPENADKILIVRKEGKIPPKTSKDGKLIYFGAGKILPSGLRYFLDKKLKPNTFYSYSVWSYNEKYKIFSDKHTFPPLKRITLTVKTKKGPLFFCQSGCREALLVKRVPFWETLSPWGIYSRKARQKVVAQIQGNTLSWPVGALTSCASGNNPCHGEPTNIDKEIYGIPKIGENYYAPWQIEKLNIEKEKLGGLSKILAIIKYNLKIVSQSEGEISQERSELLKMLVYSRKMINSCASRFAVLAKEPFGYEIKIGEEGELIFTGKAVPPVKALKCTRALDEKFFRWRGIWKKVTFLEKERRGACYGALASRFNDPLLTDRWYCCLKK